MRPTDRLPERATVRSPPGPYVSRFIESLTRDSKDKHNPGTTAGGSRAERDSVQITHNRHDGEGGAALREFPAPPERRIRRPNTTPAYYLGRPADLWISAMRPRRKCTSPPIEHGYARSLS